MSLKVTITPAKNHEDFAGSGISLLKASSGKRDSCTPNNKYKLPDDLRDYHPKAKPSDPESLAEDFCTKYKYSDHANSQVTSKWTTKPFFQNIRNVLSNANCYARKKVQSLENSDQVSTTRLVVQVVLILAAILVVAGTLVAATWFLTYPLEWTDATTPVPPRTEPPKKHCRQIGTRAACYQNGNCRWITNKHSCESDYIETVNFGV
jgi:hypothetical protein